MITACLGLGANIQNPLQQLRDAVGAIARLPDSELVAVSSVYESMPMGPQDQPRFLNACVAVTTTLEPHTLLSALKRIERDQGRVTTRRWGERCIDIDILTYDTLRIDSEDLTVPHPGLADRAFVLVPLKEIQSSNFRMPSGLDIDRLLAQCPVSGLTKLDAHLRP